MYWQQKFNPPSPPPPPPPHTHTLVLQGNRIEGKVFEMKKVFKEYLRELTEVAWRTETGVEGRAGSCLLKPGKGKSADHWTFRRNGVGRVGGWGRGGGRTHSSFSVAVWKWRKHVRKCSHFVSGTLRSVRDVVNKVGMFMSCANPFLL